LTVANEDGGAHVDPGLEEKYYDLDYLSKFEKEIFSQYWKTKNKASLEKWWNS
jgi:hypothetical protein